MIRDLFTLGQAGRGGGGEGFFQRKGGRKGKKSFLFRHYIRLSSERGRERERGCIISEGKERKGFLLTCEGGEKLVR